MVRDLFRDRSQTEFIIATIPTVLGVKESDRLATALAKEQIPCRRIIVNQVRGVPWYITSMRAKAFVMHHCTRCSTSWHCGCCLLSAVMLQSCDTAGNIDTV